MLDNSNRNIKSNGNDNIFITGDNNKIYSYYLSDFINIIKIIGKNMQNNVVLKLTEPPDIDQKIIYNKLENLKPIIIERSLYYDVIEKAKDIISNENETAMYWDNVVQIIMDKYCIITSRHPNFTPFDIWESICDEIVKENNIQDSISNNIVKLIMVHLFIQCKIFKRPPK